jgi:glucose-1-phosphate thymidylyltransferase
MKGILLAGGSGSRLLPLTENLSKHMLPVYDKPMVYYPLSTLMLADIRDVLLISTPKDIELYKKTLGDGSNFGISINYAIQENPKGIAEAFLIGKDFIQDDEVALILGDNIFYGQNFSLKLLEARKLSEGAIVFGCHVSDPDRFGVIEFDKEFKPISIDEKPDKPKSNYAVTGLYFYDNTVVQKASNLSPSQRGELEITDINKAYLNDETLKVSLLERGFTWLDTGTIDSLLDASHFVQTIEKQQGLKVACLEEIAFNKGWIDAQRLSIRAKQLSNSSYGNYLSEILKQSEQDAS